MGKLVWSRRETLVGGIAALALTAPAVIGAARPRVLVVGGGPGGLIAARSLAAGFPDLDVTLIEANDAYVTPFFSNRYLGGLQALAATRFDYRALAATGGPRLIVDRVAAIDPARREVRLAEGARLAYDRLVLAPGVSFIPDAIEGYGADSTILHAYGGSTADQWQRLGGQLTAMEDDGLVVITVPPRPYRCTPAPYERASLIAGYLKRSKPRAKLLILDANDTFPLMDAMLPFWEDEFGDSLEWLPADFGGALVALDPTTNDLITGDDRFAADVANIIPPQRAGTLALEAGLAGDDGWCPVDANDFASLRAEAIHVIGDAIEPGDMPRSAFAAADQARTCARALGAALTGGTAPVPSLENACYFLLKEGDGLVSGGRYTVTEGRITGIEGYSSDAGEDSETRAATATAGARWFKDLTGEMFG